jgi:hypothetical protein
MQLVPRIVALQAEKMLEHRRGMLLVPRLAALQAEQRRELNSTGELQTATFCAQRITVHHIATRRQVQRAIRG